MSRRLRTIIVALVTGAAASLSFPISPAVAASGYAGNNDYCLGQCNDVLPPGENGNATLADILSNKALGTRPAHTADQLDKYANLLYSYSGLTDGQISTFYNDSSFGVPADQVESTESPRSDVTIVRDKSTGVPHITGTTRAGTMFGAGYAAGEDRLFLIDLLRHVGRGQLTSFAGGSPSNRALEQDVWRNAPYTEADLQAQVDAMKAKGTRGAQLYSDVTSYVDGLNAYIAQCMANRNCPGEYVLTGHLDAVTNAGGPQNFTVTDLIAISGLIGGLFGGGGGGEMASALVRIAAEAKYGTAVGDQVWQAFREQNDPETPLTLHNGQSFPYGQSPAASGDAPSVVLPDAGSASVMPVVYDPTGSAASASTTAQAARGALPGLQMGSATEHRGMSNAVVVSAADSATGHPIAVFGPQTGYTAPQLTMLEELQGPGISARGIAFAGLNMYVLIGRGQDYAWSATSSEQDITDTYAVPLCDPAGGTPTASSTGYLFRGTCTSMDVLEQDDSWAPTTADSTPAGSYKLITYRTNYGLVAWRGTVGGKPYAFTSLRSTYRHEVDSAIGFQMYNDPSEMGTAAGFQNSASNISFAFNWFYVNSTQAAYFNSGLNPVRANGADPNLPQSTAYEWQGWNPATNTATYSAASAHPNSVDQDYYVSWNNKQAKDYSAADGNFSFGAVQRAQLLDAPMKAAVASGQKLGRADVVRIAEDAASTDLPAKQVLPLLLQVLNSQTVTDSNLAATVSSLQSWLNAGAHRVETSSGSKAYQYASAIQVFDAWWPLLVSAEFKSGLGGDLYQALINAIQINESPSGGQQGDVSSLPTSTNQAQSHKGSSFQFGWWGYVSKDLRSVLGQSVASPLPVKYCGGGDLATCRSGLLSTLSTAAAASASTVYPADSVCSAGDQWCADSIEQSPLGGVTDPLIAWQNRPTYQQVVSFPAHRGDTITDLALGKTATSSSNQSSSYTPNLAVDGDNTTRWSSASSDPQWISVDLGSVQTVGRVILNWEAAYGKAYHIDVSTDGSAWTQVYSTSTGDGGIDNDTFGATSARYVRMVGTARGTSYGYSLYELGVYQK